MNRTRRS